MMRDSCEIEYGDEGTKWCIRINISSKNGKSFMIFLERTAFLPRFLLDEEKQKILYKHNSKM
jgi:hypothetical protein